MSFDNAVTYVHHLLTSTLRPGGVAVDATMGNGWDTACMADLVGQGGVVYGFDVQPIALEVTHARTAACAADMRLYMHGHEDMLTIIAPEHIGQVQACTFNLGYLPGGDKSITTLAETTGRGLGQAREMLAKDGLITVVCYRHAEGEAELNMVRSMLSSWPQNQYTVIETDFINQASRPPVVFAVVAHTSARTPGHVDMRT